MNRVVDKMRADLAVLAAGRVAAGEWSAEDERAIAQSIRSAIEAKDEIRVGDWSRWLALLSARLLSETSGKAVAADPAQKCSDCLHFAKPGRSDGACGGRDDLVKLYGTNHPLGVLPKDGGLSCIRFKREGRA